MAMGMTAARCAMFTLALASLAGCKIVSMDESSSAEQGFDAVVYVEDLWDSEIIPHLEANASPITEVGRALEGGLDAAGEDYGYRSGEGSPWAFIVRGEGEVVEKNTESRAGVLRVAVEGLGAQNPVPLQIGPVIRGNAVRDSLPFVSFHDFTNQLEYADVGRAITARTFAGIEPQVASIGANDTVSFVGVFTMSAPSDAVLVTLIQLEVMP